LAGSQQPSTRPQRLTVRARARSERVQEPVTAARRGAGSHSPFPGDAQTAHAHQVAGNDVCMYTPAELATQTCAISISGGGITPSRLKPQRDSTGVAHSCNSLATQRNQNYTRKHQRTQTAQQFRTPRLRPRAIPGALDPASAREQTPAENDWVWLRRARERCRAPGDLLCAPSV
jgi:hypothetical protein